MRKVSVIIPALNEEENIGFLLNDIHRQLPEAQVIVADSWSEDETQSVVLDFWGKFADLQLVLTPEPKPGPALARNTGAAFADGDDLVFLDADARLPENFFQNVFDEMERRGLEAAGCQMKPRSEVLFDQVNWFICNFSAVARESFSPVAMGAGLIAARKPFLIAGGFCNEMKVFEDVDFARRMSRISQFGILQDEGTEILHSMRRFEVEGRLNVVTRYIWNGIYYTLTGKVPQSMKYEYGKFGGKK